MNREKLRHLLETKYKQYNTTAFIETDPIQIPHSFTKKEDIEIAAFLTATIAWGQRTTICNNARRLLKYMDNSPHDFVLHFTKSELSPLSTFTHRTFNGEDCLYFLQALQMLYRKYQSLEYAFFPSNISKVCIPKHISDFKKLFFSLPHPKRSEKHIADPVKGSTAKRINMLLRWMVRKDKQGVDFGIWDSVKAKDLYCPLDVHAGRTARKLGILTRRQNDWKAVEELTNSLRHFDPDDPIKYDFALFGMAAVG